jgi:hypothetical protein
MPAVLARTSATAAALPVARPTTRRTATIAAPSQQPKAAGRPTAAARAASSSSSSSSAPPANPVRQLLSGLASTVYKMQAPKEADPRLAGSPLWQALEKLDEPGVRAALKNGASPDEPSPVTREAPLIMIAKQGHYKYPPAGIPTALIDAGANLEVKDPATGNTPFELSLLKGWQNIGYLLYDRDAKTSGVDAAFKARLTCPDCRRLVAEKGL